MSLHYFIERNTANDNISQAQSQQFGPVIGLENEEYRTTSLFNINQDTKAYAVTQGQILIFDNEAAPTELVNIVLMTKAKQRHPTLISPGVRYFIYRGLKRADFITQSGSIDVLNSSFMSSLNSNSNNAYTNIDISDCIPSK